MCQCEANQQQNQLRQLGLQGYLMRLLGGGAAAAPICQRCRQVKGSPYGCHCPALTAEDRTERVKERVRKHILEHSK